MTREGVTIRTISQNIQTHACEKSRSQRLCEGSSGIEALQVSALVLVLAERYIHQPSFTYLLHTQTRWLTRLL